MGRTTHAWWHAGFHMVETLFCHTYQPFNHLSLHPFCRMEGLYSTALCAGGAGMRTHYMPHTPALPPTFPHPGIYTCHQPSPPSSICAHAQKHHAATSSPPRCKLPHPTPASSQPQTMPSVYDMNCMLAPALLNAVGIPNTADT